MPVLLIKQRMSVSEPPLGAVLTVNVAYAIRHLLVGMLVVDFLL